jgi:hypothetical protein
MSPRYYAGPISDHFDGARFLIRLGRLRKKQAGPVALVDRSSPTRYESEVAGLGAVAVR